jgi:putative Mg2+ transporter-C (MgtC) family protein
MVEMILFDMELILRLALAAGIGYLIGLERQVTGHAAGDRTFALTCLGSALFTVVALRGFPDISDRVAGGIVTGLGFLGAGLIFRTTNREVKGLTTAAAVWSTGAIGMAIGSGLYAIGLVSAVLVLFLLASEYLLGVDSRLAAWRARRKKAQKLPKDEPPPSPPAEPPRPP